MEVKPTASSARTEYDAIQGSLHQDTEPIKPECDKKVARGSNNDSENDTDNDDSSYLKLVLNYGSFRLYLYSYIITHIGEWLTYIASISLIEEILGEENRENSRSAISILVVVRLLPNVLISPFGGVLADSRDRRVSMITLDLLGGFVALLFMVAIRLQSIRLIYLVTFLQECVAGLYEPCRASIVPMLVPDEEYRKKAYTLNGILWSLMASVGAFSGGLIVSYFGFYQCFLFDSMTYITSAIFMWRIGGAWNAAVDERSKSQSVWGEIKMMAIDGSKYLSGSFWRALVFLKATSAIIYGATDVLNVSFSEMAGYEGSSERLGLIFAVVGIGCIIGPILAEPFIIMSKPSTIQIVCIFSLFINSVGCFGLGLFGSFWTILLFSLVRSAGSSANWINSSLLLQKFSSIDMLGRVSAVDFALALLSEAFMADLCGTVQDRLGLSAQEVSVLIGTIGFALTGLWALYHGAGMGAADITAVEADAKDKAVKESDILSTTDTAGVSSTSAFSHSNANGSSSATEASSLLA